MVPLIRTCLAFFWVAVIGALWLGALGLRARRPHLRAAQPAIDFAIGGAVLAIAWVIVAPFEWPGPSGVEWRIGQWLPGLLALPPGVFLLARPFVSRSRKRRRLGERVPPIRPMAWLLLLVLAAVALGIAAHAYTTPMYIDGRHIWGSKAKALFLDGMIERETFTNLARYRYTALDHPLALPAVEAWVYQALGEVDERSAKLTGIVYWLGINAVLVCFLRRRMALEFALALALVAVTIPPFIFYAGAGGADVPLAFYFLAAGVLLVEYAESGRAEDGILSGLLFGSAGVMKSEGLTMAIGGGLALIIMWWWRRPRLSRGEIAKVVLAVALPPLPWLGLRMWWSIPSPQLLSLTGQTMDDYFARAISIAGEISSRLTDWKTWEASWLFVGLGLLAWIVARGRPRAFAFLWALLLWQFAVDVAVYMTNPYDINWTLAASLDRLILQLMPLGIAAAACSLAETVGKAKTDAGGTPTLPEAAP